MYETRFKLYAEVPEGFQNPNIRNPPVQLKHGSFSDYVYRWGDVDGWDHELISKPAAEASASGDNTNTDESNETEAIAPTAENAIELIIACDLCDEDGCAVCNVFR